MGIAHTTREILPGCQVRLVSLEARYLGALPGWPPLGTHLLGGLPLRRGLRPLQDSRPLVRRVDRSQGSLLRTPEGSGSLGDLQADGALHSDSEQGWRQGNLQEALFQEEDAVDDRGTGLGLRGPGEDLRTTVVRAAHRWVCTRSSIIQ